MKQKHGGQNCISESFALFCHMAWPFVDRGQVAVDDSLWHFGEWRGRKLEPSKALSLKPVARLTSSEEGECTSLSHYSFSYYTMPYLSYFQCQLKHMNDTIINWPVMVPVNYVNEWKIRSILSMISLIWGERSSFKIVCSMTFFSILNVSRC